MFNPVNVDNAEYLILGSYPSDVSINRPHKGCYYANIPRNDFWGIMGSLFDDEVINNILKKDYKDITDDDFKCMIDRLPLYNIGIWDVCKSANRDGNSDNKIKSYIVNEDLESKINANKKLKRICFNGRKAERLFKKHFPRLFEENRKYIPSSSKRCPMDYKNKFDEWRNALG